VTTIAEAASVLLARGPGSPEVFVVRRAERLRAFGGFHAFPGGKVCPTDGDLLPAGTSSNTWDTNVRRVAAARELFEETGILLARRPDGTFPPSGPEFDSPRRELSEGRLTFAEVLARLGLALNPADFAGVGAFVTPAFSALRFDTSFFVAHLPPGQRAEVWPGELDSGRWTTGAAMLEEWGRGECLVAPPALSILQAIRGRPVDEVAVHLAPLLAATAAGAIPPIFYAPQVQMVPLQTLALPPSTHTNAYLVGSGPVYLLDPGSSEPAEQQLLFDVLDVQQALGRRLTAVVLSHHHIDHVGAAAVTARRYGVPIWAHPQTARALEGRIAVDRTLQDGDRLDLGPTPDSGGPWHLEAIHTPGHASGHLAFYDPHYRLLFAGDMVSTLSSIVIAPPDGDLAVYLDSLRRLRGYDCRLLLPSHGGPSARPGDLLDETLAHRRGREEQLLAALGKGLRQVGELAQEMYPGLPTPLVRFAELQVRAGLQKLQREQRVQRSEAHGQEEWELRADGPPRGAGL
jgi:glyoxylase-like metal-dependent hydrolase (beta-lactamase superfamily II)/8-oxo-dGTP pyrophosphatase MutT (NUDIX family)